jgi:hypothetical protein
VRLLTAINGAETTRDACAQLLFTLCRGDVDRLIKHTGYGNAAGLLAARGLLAGGGAATTTSSDDEEADYADVQHRINPVTGCVADPAVEAEHERLMANMSDEQKEYEAEQLIQSMHRLIDGGCVRPAFIGPDGRPREVSHVLELVNANSGNKQSVDEDVSD